MGTTLAPPRSHGVLLLVAAALLVAVAVTADRPGQVLLVPAALAAAGLGARDLLLRPVLTADDAGLVVVDGLRRRAASWAEVERVRVVTDRRTPVLELDLGDAGLVVVSRRRLGASPAQAVEALEALRP